MPSRLVNIRLDEEHIEKVRKLRARGVALSTLLREAVDTRFAQLATPPSRREVRAIVDTVFEVFPDPKNLPKRAYDVHDRRQAAAAIRRRLRRSR